MARFTKHRGKVGTKPGREAFQDLLAEWKQQGVKPPRTLLRFSLPTLPMRGGLNRCCWCGTMIKGRKIRWCGEGCLLEYKIAIGCQSTIRRLVEHRDRGVCAGCGVDTRILEFQLRYYQHAFRIGIPLQREALRCFFMTMIPWSTKDEAQVYGDSLKILDVLWENLLPRGWEGIDSKRAQTIYRRFVGSGTFIRGQLQHLWEADHILAVEDGGGAGCTLENFRTLCRPCHLKRSAEQAAARAQRKRVLTQKD